MSLHNVEEYAESAVFECGKAYDIVCENLGKDVLSATGEEKQKAKENVMPYVRYQGTGVFEELSDDESWAFLKECSAKRAAVCAERRKGWEAALDTFSPEDASEIRAYLGDKYFGNVFFDFIVKKDGSLSIVMEDYNSFSRMISLEGARWEDGAPDARHLEADLVKLAPDPENGGVILTLRLLEGGESEKLEYRARFSSARIVKMCFNTLGSYIFGALFPYKDNNALLRVIISACFDIVRKAHSCRELINEKELAVVPLCKELCRLHGYPLSADGRESDPSEGFPLLSALAREHGAEDIIPLLEAAGRACKELNDAAGHAAASASKNYDAAYGRLARRLLDCRYEPFMRALFERIYDTQKDYPRKYVLSDEHINTVTETLRALGYQGEYPLFSRRGTVKRSVFETGIDGRRHTVKGGDAVSFVFCAGGAYYTSEDHAESYASFISATRVFSHGESRDADLFSCFFLDKNRRICRETSGDPYEILDGKPLIVGLTEAAAKRAELKKLSKAETRKLGNKSDSGMTAIIRNCAAAILIALMFYACGVALGIAIGAICGALAALLSWDISAFTGIFAEDWKVILIAPAVVIPAVFILYKLKNIFNRWKN